MPAQKGFSPILVIVGVFIMALLLGGAFFLGRSSLSNPTNEAVIETVDVSTPSPSPSSAFKLPPKISEPENWPVYTDNEAGFSFPYPDVFRVESIVESPDKRIVNVIYNNPYPRDLAPEIPPDKILEITVFKSSEMADVYANKVIEADLKNPEVILLDPGVVLESISSTPDYKAFLRTKKYSGQDIRYDFLNHKGNLIQIKTFIPNATAAMGNSEQYNYMIYRMKLN